ncbi:MAG: UDP-N-acetylglucosamine pyrophosphorylase [Ruminococcaceae bacterium]|nr:UDP-N-acetylglucosamine pyrophosphorylase [Oscillospiraceae bacterium]
MKTNELFDFEKTIAAEVFENCEYPWQVLPKIKEFTIQLGQKLDKENFDEISPNVWVSKSAKVAHTAFIAAPCIIDDGAEVRHCAFIRGGVIVGKNCVVGNSTEMKNAIIFDNVQIPHFNYVGDSVLGYKSHLGAGAVTSNVKSDKTLVTIKNGDEKIETGMKKFGAMVGDFTEVGCNSVLCPGTVVGRNCTIYPLSRVRGYIKENSIFKSEENIVEKK